jgi:hypothetical protein
VRAYECDPVAIDTWKEKDYPKLKARAKRFGAEIFIIDEAGVRSDAALQRCCSAKGETPIVPTSGKRQEVNAISAVNATGAFWYNVYTGKFNAQVFIAKLKAFMRNRTRPVFLVLDGHPVCIAPTVSRTMRNRSRVGSSCTSCRATHLIST